MNCACAYYDTAKHNLLILLLLLRTALQPYWQSLVHLNCACVYHNTLPLHKTVIPERGSWRLPPRSRVGAHKIKRAVSVCPHFLASISRCRLLSQDRKLCFCRLRVKVARSRRQIQNHEVSHLQYYLSFLDLFKNMHLKWIITNFILNFRMI